MSLGYFEDFRGYRTQGDSLAELQSNLRELYSVLASGVILGIRRLAELTIGWRGWTLFECWKGGGLALGAGPASSRQRDD